MKRNNFLLLCLVLACGLLAVGLHSAAARPKGGGGGRGGGGGGSAPGNSANAVTPATGPSNPQAVQALSDMRDAETAVDEMFETSAEWLKAQNAIKQAQSDYNDACGPVIDGLKAQPAYAAAMDAQTKADGNLKDMQTTGSQDQISDAAQADMQAKSAVKAMEAKAIQTDPTTIAAKQQLTAAYATLAALRQKEQGAVQADPDWLAAKKRLDAARGK
jgi:hypothetical protein